MKKLLTLECDPKKIELCAQKLSSAIQKQYWVQLLPPMGQRACIPEKLLPNGPGIVISSGGSSGGPHASLLQCISLDQSAKATGTWLKELGLNPNDCLIINPLPIHHVSGLMPWWRSRYWGSKYNWIEPSLMRNPSALEETFSTLFKTDPSPKLISLVPTQLKRLLSHPKGIIWLRSFSVIWVGGAALSQSIEAHARKENIPLAPCYGATETAAMVTALPPQDFLQGISGCGSPLMDIELRINHQGVLEVKTPRLAKALWKNENLVVPSDSKGWWKSGDKASLTEDLSKSRLKIIGRIDHAIHSGGETVFPEHLEARLHEQAEKEGLPIQHILFLPVEDKEWGQRLVGLVKWREGDYDLDPASYMQSLKSVIKDWQPAQKPINWYVCKELSPSSIGKWERSKWIEWLKAQTMQPP